MAQAKLPAQPAMAIGATTVSMVQPVKVAGQGSGEYRAPAGYQSPDLADYCQPPASLGQFYPKS
jgi:hypothetical protein